MGSITFRIGDYLNKKPSEPEQRQQHPKPSPSLRKSWRLRKEPTGNLVYAQELVDRPHDSTRVLWTNSYQPKDSPRAHRHLNNDDLAKLRAKYLGNSKN